MNRTTEENNLELFERENNAPTFKLERFEGPLDLLLSLISKNKVDIYDIPISVIFDQYMDYIHSMELFNMEIASSFIVMASQLMLIKSRLLLPVHEDEEDPRKELVDMLLEYQRAKMTAEVLHDRELTFWGRFEKPSEQIELPSEYTMTHDLVLLQNAILQVLARTENSEVTEAEKEHNLEEHLHATQKTSVEEKINFVVKRIEKNGKCKLCQLFENVKTRDEVVATFLALLELIKTMAVSVKYNSSDYSDCDIELCK